MVNRLVSSVASSYGASATAYAVVGSIELLGILGYGILFGVDGGGVGRPMTNERPMREVVEEPRAIDGRPSGLVAEADHVAGFRQAREARRTEDRKSTLLHSGH